MEEEEEEEWRKENLKKPQKVGGIGVLEVEVRMKTQRCFLENVPVLVVSSSGVDCVRMRYHNRRNTFNSR